MQGAAVQLLHVQEIADLLAQVLLAGRFQEDMNDGWLYENYQNNQKSPKYRSLRYMKLSLALPKALSQLFLKFWLVQKLWMRLHSVFLPLMQMYFCSSAGWWKKGAFFSLLGMQYRLKMRVVLLEQSLQREPKRSLLCGRWLYSWQSMFINLPRRQLYYDAALSRSFSRSTDLYCSLGSTTTILDSNLEYEYFSSSQFCPLISESRLQSTLCLALFFSSIIITFSDFLGAMGSICSLTDDQRGRLTLVCGAVAGCLVSLQLWRARSRLLGRSMVCEILRGVLQYCFLVLFINNKFIMPAIQANIITYSFFCVSTSLDLNYLYNIFELMGDFWKPTADLFAALIDKPKMSERLLIKPPFKYLFDIITETTKKTTFANGLYSGQELNPEFHSDKDKKIAYLQKIIKVVELMIGGTVEAKPQKIVAGLEPEATNELLQLIHKCATSGKSSDPYVNKVLGKSEPEPEKKEEKKEVGKPNRPPSAARIKKPAEQPVPASKKKEEEEEEAPPPPQPKPEPVEEKPAKQVKKTAQQDAEYSQNIKRIKAEAENEVAAQKQTEKEQKGKNQINLGKLGGKGKKKDTSEKIISAGGDLTDKELQLVQSMIQSICQNTAPLGKSIEFINDDVDAMNKQLTFWRKQYNASKSKTQNELKLTQEALLPIFDKIHEIEEQILDQKAKIQTTKAQILKNDSVIRDLLMSVVTTK